MPSTEKFFTSKYLLGVTLSFLVFIILLLVLTSSYDFFIKYTFFISTVVIHILLFYSFRIVNSDNKNLLNEAVIPNSILLDALNYVSDHIVVTDRNGIILYANKQVEIITGFSKKEIIGTKAGTSTNWGGVMDAPYYESLWKKLLKNEAYSGLIKNKRKNGEIYDALVSIYPVEINKKEKYFVALERDITHEKELDRMKTDFISLASHQLRTPLSAMKWYIEMLLDGDAGVLTDEQKSYLNNINGSNERMIELVNSLLNISRVESGRLIVDPKETNIINVVEDVIADVKPKAKERGVTFIFEGVPSLPTIISDPKLLRNVYMNLLTNAIKYTPTGGYVSLKVSKTDSEIISEVSDTGMGIPKKDHEKIFTRFFRAENARGKVTDGNGLGLYLVKAIIEVCGGNIEFKSKEGEGTQFTFRLPIKGTIAKKGEVTID